MKTPELLQPFSEDSEEELLLLTADLLGCSGQQQLAHGNPGHEERGRRHGITGVEIPGVAAAQHQRTAAGELSALGIQTQNAGLVAGDLKGEPCRILRQRTAVQQRAAAVRRCLRCQPMLAVTQIAAALQLVKPLDAPHDAAVRYGGAGEGYLRTESGDPLCDPLPLGGKRLYLQPVNAVFHGCTSVYVILCRPHKRVPKEKERKVQKGLYFRKVKW
jgi:hypothetical protein